MLVTAGLLLLALWLLGLAGLYQIGEVFHAFLLVGLMLLLLAFARARDRALRPSPNDRKE